MAGHFVGPDCTSAEVPAIHAGVNSKFASYTLEKTASGSTTIAICALPAGARVTNCTTTWDNSDLNTTGGGNVSTQIWIAGSSVGQAVQSSSGGVSTSNFNPEHDLLSLRLTSSANVVIALTDMPGTGTATTVFRTLIQYTADLDGD